MEDLELDNTKKKLFQKAAIDATQNQAQFAGPPSLGPPLSINLNTTEGGIENAAIDYRFPQNQSGGQFTVGGTIAPGYETEVFPGQTMSLPTNHRVYAGYGNNNYRINLSHGTRGFGGGVNAQMQF